jgi:hypothetical protein
VNTPRRRLVRRPSHPPTGDERRQRQLARLRVRLEAQRAALVRWMSRLRRAFHAVEKHQQGIHRIERQITHLEGS